MIGAALLAHLVGDYLLQNDWIANRKTQSWRVAALHGLLYTLPFMLVTQSWAALAVIASTHVVIDRLRLVKHLIWLVNAASPRSWRYAWPEARDNMGFKADKPVWMAFWLMVVIDNTTHMLINVGAIKWL